MARYKPNREVRADWWDADEHATFLGTLGFLAAQRVAYHVAQTKLIGTPATPEQIQTLVDHMVAPLLEMLLPEGWTLALPSGEPVPLTEAGLCALPVADLAYLFREAFPADPETVVTNPDTPMEEVTYQPTGMITPEAEAAGLNAANFPFSGATPLVVRQ
jgi:hypothetical protein